MEQRLMAFWYNDSYPFVLWGEIISFTKMGSVEVKGYDGHYFKPVLILPFDDGDELMFHLKILSANRNAEISDIENNYLDKARDMLLKYKADFKFKWEK